MHTQFSLYNCILTQLYLTATLCGFQIRKIDMYTLRGVRDKGGENPLSLMQVV
jgi:hypothetical protein